MLHSPAAAKSFTLCLHSATGSKQRFPSAVDDQTWRYFKALHFVPGSKSEFPPLALLPGLPSQNRGRFFLTKEVLVCGFCAFKNWLKYFVEVDFLRWKGHLSPSGSLVKLSIIVWVSLLECSLGDVNQQLSFPNCFIFCGITSSCETFK